MTEVIEDILVWQKLRNSLPKTHTIGFVPTMGNLHQGHLSLCKRSQQENHKTCVSIFVNPTQFNNTDDFIHYPQTLDADLDVLQKHDVDYCFLPTQELLYQDNYRYRITEYEYANILEGAARVNHYTGVLTIVMKLLNIIKPSAAYFGEKDNQQYELIKGMVEAFFMNIKIHVCPTVREDTGLAYSSRNSLLSIQQRNQAVLFAKIFHQTNKPIEIIKLELEDAGIKVDYIHTHNNRRYIAVFIGDIRLIDNYAII